MPAAGRRSEQSGARATSSLRRRLWPAARGCHRNFHRACGHLPPASARQWGSTPQQGSRRIYIFAAALGVRSRVSNPRPIALAPSNPCPESLSVGDLATSPAPDPRAHALWLTHCASLPFWQAPCTGSGRRAATAASRAAHERLSLYGAPLQPAAVLAAGERGWRAPASVWPVGPAEGRQRVVSARRLRPGSGRDLVPAGRRSRFRDRIVSVTLACIVVV